MRKEGERWGQWAWYWGTHVGVRGWLHGCLFLRAGRAGTLGFPLDVLWSQPELQPSSSLAQLIFSHQSKIPFLSPVLLNSQDPGTVLGQPGRMGLLVMQEDVYSIFFVIFKTFIYLFMATLSLGCCLDFL